MPVNARVFGLILLTALALVPVAGGTVNAPKTTAPDVFVNIQVKMTDSRITLDRHSATRGDQGRFILRNLGKRPHSFTLGVANSKNRQQRLGFSKVLNPGKQAILIIFLDYRGPLPYRSILPHDRGIAGMRGTFNVH